MQALHKLVDASYLRPSTVLSHISPRDKRITYETEEKAKISGFPTAKELRQAKEMAEVRLKREEEEAEQIGMVSNNVLPRVTLKFCNIQYPQKRKAKDFSGRSSKVSEIFGQSPFHLLIIF